ncbi:hypothetical protein F2P45_18695 [Massilia sp. CCM 8733]|uniref:Uncharacterized protein n=1 Tax=Massilia mucilaginosa TaxID=2609282 RepID=A0ABX0NWE3_9BURK|nr:hypothetical protein [Massilia mucilaginosa]NHZ91031.1 hypothetical protein [Massilia mucilaginosa]
MKGAKVSLAILLVISSVYARSEEPPARSELCKSTRIALLKQADKPLILPDKKLSKKEYNVVTTERACVQSYGIGYPGGVAGLMKATATEFKADLVLLTGLVNTAKNKTLSRAQLQAVVEELTPQKNSDNQTLNASNRDTMRTKQIQDGMNREQMLLWGHHLYLRKLYEEGSDQKLIDEVLALQGQFNMAVASRTWDEAESHTYFSVQSLKNMITIYAFKAQARLAKGNGQAGKALLANYMKARKAFIPMFGVTGGDPTGEIRAPYCAMKLRKG